jgi:prephenate dehydrogenase
MTFGIIGLGRFGQLWANALLPFGAVYAYDNSTSPLSIAENITLTTLQEVTQADIIFVLVPISAFEACCLDIQKTVKPSSIIVECCSVKTYSVQVMQSVFASRQALVATHPLFGPDSVKKSQGIVDHTMVMCPLVHQEAHQQLETLFQQMGLNILTTTPEAHDEQMARSQGLVHFIGRGLQSLNLAPQTLATPDFNALLSINSMVANDSWQLFLDMHRYNPYARDIRQQFMNQLMMIDKTIG